MNYLFFENVIRKLRSLFLLYNLEFNYVAPKSGSIRYIKHDYVSLWPYICYICMYIYDCIHRFENCNGRGKAVSGQKMFLK